MPTVFEVPLTMLVTALEFGTGGRGEILGYWYFGKHSFGSTAATRRQFDQDAIEGKACRLELRGTQEQLSELLEVAAGMSEDPETIGAAVLKALESTSAHEETVLEFDSLTRPKGTAIPVFLLVRVLGDEAKLLAQLREGPDLVELQLDPEWRAGDDLLRALGDP